MSTRHSLPIDLHTGDDLAKARALRSRATSGRILPLVIAIVVVVVAAAVFLPRPAKAAQGYAVPVTVEGGDAARVDLPVGAPVDLTLFLAGLPGALDPTTFQVVEVDSAGAVLDAAVPFQFDPDPAFDAVTHAAGTLVFVLNDTTPAMSTREYRVLFDVVGGCGDCPAPPSLPDSVAVDSLMYENQETFLISTPRADYYYHRAGAGLASIIDNDSQDWISFHDVPGSQSAGEYRGIPNLVFRLGDAAASFFHPGFTNATTELVSTGPLKVSLRSVTNDPSNEWIVHWDFYPDFSRMTVEQVGSSNGGDYWYLYEGTPGGALDAGDVVIRSDGTTTSAMDNAERWEDALGDPQWVAFHDTAGDRYLYVNDDAGDAELDSYRSQGQTSSSTPEMTVFGLGRVLNTTSNALVPRMSGVGRSFTMGLGESAADIADEIACVTRPVVVLVGDPADAPSAVGEVARPMVLRGAFPNPFNPSTRIGFSLARAGQVQLAVYDLAGRLVRTLASGHLEAGEHAVAWDGRDASGGMAASGVYLCRLEAGGTTRTGKMALVE